MLAGNVRRAVTIAAALLSFLGAGCTHDAVVEPITDATSVAASGQEGHSVIVPMCKLGCMDVDPDPEAPGVFLGSGVTDEVCFTSAQTDNDADGLSTFCENNLAMAFAPELRYAYGDEVGREPYWAARPGSGGTVVIAYLISYYRDAGSSAGVCNLPPPLYDPSCDGHNGDSETIFLEVYYNSETHHWVLGKATYSQHESYSEYATSGGSGFDYPYVLEYPGHPGVYPRSYVSEGKHANYSSEIECEAGANFAADTCAGVDTSERLLVSGAYNVGSHSVHLIDCVGSRDSYYIYYGSGRLECYWTTSNFRGWIPTSVGGAESSPYHNRLIYGGF